MIQPATEHIACQVIILQINLDLQHWCNIWDSPNYLSDFQARNILPIPWTNEARRSAGWQYIENIFRQVCQKTSSARLIRLCVHSTSKFALSTVQSCQRAQYNFLDAVEKLAPNFFLFGDVCYLAGSQTVVLKGPSGTSPGTGEWVITTPLPVFGSIFFCIFF